MAPGLFVYDCLFLNEDAAGTHILSVCLASVIETLEVGRSHFQPGGARFLLALQKPRSRD